MPVTDEDVFASMQQELEYESHLNEARRLLKTAESDPSFYDRAIAEVRMARRFLAPGASPSELDAIVGAANSGKDQVERDRIERENKLIQEKNAEIARKERDNKIEAHEIEMKKIEEEQARARMMLVLKCFAAVAAVLLGIYFVVNVVLPAIPTILFLIIAGVVISGLLS